MTDPYIGINGTKIEVFDNDLSVVKSIKQLAEQAIIYANNPPSTLVPAVGDGATDDTPAIQAMIDSLTTSGGYIMFLPKVYKITATLVLPLNVSLIGQGNYYYALGTRFRWSGGNNTSVMELHGYNTLKNIFIYNNNAATGVTAIDAYDPTGVRLSTNLHLHNISAKSFSAGFAFSYSFYNDCNQLFALYCDTGFKIAGECNNTTFTSCHATFCGYGIQITGAVGTRAVTWIGCSFESNTIIGIDITVQAVSWSFLGTYCEDNKQTARLAGNGVIIDNIFINHDWVNVVGNNSPACIEILQCVRVEIKNIYFSSDIPVTNGISFTDINSFAIGVVYIGSILPYGSLYLQQTIINYPALITLDVFIPKDSLSISGIIPINSWNTAPGTFTYASANTITVASGAASIYQKGDKLRLKQGAGYKYYYIITVADTLLTVTGGTNFTVANAAITDVAYSHIENPLGFPNTFSFTTTPSTGGAAYTNLPSIDSAIFWVKNNILTYIITWTYHATSGGTVSSKFTIPIVAAVNAGSGVNGASGVSLSVSAVTNYIYVYKYDGTSPIVNAQQCFATVSITI